MMGAFMGELADDLAATAWGGRRARRRARERRMVGSGRVGIVISRSGCVRAS
jgi:hypothetical protein